MSSTAILADPVRAVAPRFPADRGGVAILGCGTIAHSAHLPAYQQYGVGVVGVWSRSASTTAETRSRFPFVEHVYGSVDELLADPRVRIVDIATGPDSRPEWIAAALKAGKHVLAQKPLAATAADLAVIERVAADAHAAGLRVAVNHNGRWAPAWRAATLLVREGAIGEVVGVTHLHDKPLPPLVGTPFDDVAHMLLTDYLVHWIDITLGWLGDADVAGVHAVDSRTPGQNPLAKNPWSATLHLGVTSGASATLRIVGNVTASEPGCPFWIHGTEGTIRGSVLMNSDRVMLDRDGEITTVPLQGAWFVDGFAAAMGELMCAIDEGRDPENSAVSAARTVRVMLAGAESAERGGVPVRMGERS